MRSPSTPTVLGFTLALLSQTINAAPLPQQQQHGSIQGVGGYNSPGSPGDACSPAVVTVEVDETVTSIITTTVRSAGEGTAGAVKSPPTPTPAGSGNSGGLPGAGYSKGAQTTPLVVGGARPNAGNPFSSSSSTSLGSTGGSAGGGGASPTPTAPSNGPSGASSGTAIDSVSSDSAAFPPPATPALATPSPSPKPSGSSAGSGSSATGSSPSAASPSATASPSGGAGGSSGSPKGGKAGIGYNDASLLKAFAGKVAWAQNWEQNNDGVPAGMAYYPTLWNDDGGRVSRWKASAEAAVARGDNVLFSFNEPIKSFCPGNPGGHQEQPCMEAGVAATVWKEQMLPYKSKATLVAPSVPQGDEGATWLSDFVKACPKAECGWTALNLHWYEGAHQIEYFKQYFTDAHNNPAYGNPDIWVGEFKATAGTDEEKKRFYQDAKTWMDSQPFIKGYAAFMAEELAPGGSLTPVGQAYAS